MGLCKCRRTTRLYCFVHREHVCESCLASGAHRTCYVRRYVDWLQGGEWTRAVCVVCHVPPDVGAVVDDVVRLPCLDITHRRCLRDYIASLPPHTAPAGVVCPACAVMILPTLAPAGGPPARPLLADATLTAVADLELVQSFAQRAAAGEPEPAAPQSPTAAAGTAAAAAAVAGAQDGTAGLDEDEHEAEEMVVTVDTAHTVVAMPDSHASGSESDAPLSEPAAARAVHARTVRTPAAALVAEADVAEPAARPRPRSAARSATRRRGLLLLAVTVFVGLAYMFIVARLVMDANE